MGKKWTLERAIESVAREASSVELVSLEKVGRRTHFNIRCACGECFYVQPHLFFAGKHSCNYCTGKPRYTISDIERIVNSKSSARLLSVEYKNANTPLDFLCSCGEPFSTDLNKYRTGKTTCDQCTNKRLSEKFLKSQSTFERQITEALGEEYFVVGKYRGVAKKVQIRHQRCGSVWNANPNDVLHKASGCPACAASKGEAEVSRHLTQLGVTFRTQYRITECRNVRPLPFDFAVFDNGELTLLIEYDGVQHFNAGHFTEDTLRLTQTNDKIKNEFCVNNGIPLLRIPYYDFENIPQILRVALRRITANNKTIPSQAG